MREDHAALISSYLDDELTDRQQRELGDWLREDAANLKLFLAECRCHSLLLLKARARPHISERSVCSAIAGRATAAAMPASAEREMMNEGLLEDAGGARVVAPARPPSLILFPSFVDRFGPVGRVFLCYVAVALVMGAGILGGRAWRAADRRSGPADQTAETPDSSRGQIASLPRDRPPQARSIVAWIASAIDCRWNDPSSAVTDGAAVSLGSRFALASGILEIRYPSGPDVIVQGPAVYEVDSDRGGLLRYGRLTARVEPRWDRNEDFAWLLQLGAGQEGPGFNGQGSGAGVQGSGFGVRGRAAGAGVAPPAPFVIRTPEAKISAPLGAEFGLEVGPSRLARAHVFAGNVTLRLPGMESEAAGGISLAAGQLARTCTADGRSAVSVLPGGATPEAFARRVFVKAPLKASPVDQLAIDHWLKRIGRQGDGPLVAVGAEEPGDRGQGSGFRGQGAEVGGRRSGPGLPAAVTYTYRASFEVAGVLPTTAVVRVRFLTRGCITGVRFNGQTAVQPVFDDRKLRDAGCFVARRDAVRPVNTVEIDVSGGASAPGDEGLMLLGIRITAIRPPRQAASADALRRGREK